MIVSSNTRILSLPTEIMELIIHYLESVKDLQNCIKVCKSWRQIILTKYRNKRYIRIMSGEETNSWVTSEIIDLLDCKVANIITEGKNHYYLVFTSCYGIILSIAYNFTKKYDLMVTIFL